MPRPIRIAAAGDVHCDEVNRDEIERAFARVEGEVDAILLAGDLTTYGELEQGELLAELCAPLETPIYAVLGNHDWHCNQAAELTTALEADGVRMVDRGHAIERLDDTGSVSPARKVSSVASPTRRCPTSASRCSPRLCRDDRRGGRALDGSCLDRRLRLPDRAAALPRRRRARSTASRAASTRSSAPIGWPSRSSSITRT